MAGYGKYDSKVKIYYACLPGTRSRAKAQEKAQTVFYNAYGFYIVVSFSAGL